MLQTKQPLRLNYSLITLVGIVCALPSFIFSYNYALNLYYEYGCPLEDQGILAYAMWRNNLCVQFPSSYPFFGNECSYFIAHISPIFSATSILSKIINVDMVSFFAFFQGVSHSLLAFSMFFILCLTYEITGIKETIFSFLIALIFSLNGISISSMLYPHFEMLFVPLSAFFLMFLVEKKPMVALPFFIFSLSIRECSGFHLFALIFFLILIDFLKKRIIYKPYFLYAGLAIIYSILALIIQKLLKSDTSISVLECAYLGTQPFSHLSWELIKERTFFILNNRGYFYIPIAIILIWTIVSRKPYLSFGIIAFIPWFLFNFLAVSTWASGIYLYYGSFYLLIFLWPLLASKAFYAKDMTQQIKEGIFKWYSLIILSSTLFNNPFHVNDFLLKPGVSQEHIFKRLQSSLLYNLSQLGNVVVDARVVSLAPGSFSKNQVLYLRKKTAKDANNFFYQPNPTIKEEETVDSVMFYNSTFRNGLVPFYILASKLPYMYQVIGTNVYLASNKNIQQLTAFSSVLVPLQYSYKELFSNYTTTALNNAYFRKDIKHIDHTFFVDKKSLPGVVVYSFPIRLPKGEYCIQFKLEMSNPSDPKKPIITVDAVSQNEIQTLVKKKFFYHDITSLSDHKVQIRFKIKDNFPNALIAFRFFHHQNTDLVIKDIGIREF